MRVFCFWEICLTFHSMKQILIIVATIIITLGCNTQVKKTLVSDIADEKAILDVMAMQESAWSAGDLDTFMEGYWKSEDLVFVGRNGPQYGWQTTLDNYKKGYPDKSAMGKLQFEVVRMTRISDDAYSMIGMYTLIRAEDQPSGYFTLVWKKIKNKWLIVSDHTSG